MLTKVWFPPEPRAAVKGWQWVALDDPRLADAIEAVRLADGVAGGDVLSAEVADPAMSAWRGVTRSGRAA